MQKYVVVGYISDKAISKPVSAEIAREIQAQFPGSMVVPVMYTNE